MPRLYLEGNRKQRVAQLKRGPGVFVYDGQETDTEWSPTILRTKHQTHELGDDGLPKLDKTGRAVMKPAGMPVYDNEGRVQLGGPPEVEERPIAVFELWGVKFPAGEAVEVSDPRLALKLRGMGCFEEVEGEPRPKRGRKAKAEASAE